MGQDTAIRIYYLDGPLSDDEVAKVEEYLRTCIEQVRIPAVLPAPEPDGGYSHRPLCDSGVVGKHLERAGVARDAGTQVGLVAPADAHWYGALMEGLRQATGLLPIVVQTAAQRAAIGNPGPLRTVDAHGLAEGLRSR